MGPALDFTTPELELAPAEKKFRWTKKADFAAQWLAEGNLYYKDIAAKLEIPVSRLNDWRQHTEFKARIQSLRDQYKDFIYNRGIARLELRVETYLQDWSDLEKIRLGRANQGTNGSAPVPPSEMVVEGEVISFSNPHGSGIPTQEGGAEVGNGMFNPAGGIETGFIVKDYKGKDADQPVYTFDKSLFDARLKLRQQLATELGQWQQKVAIDQPTNQVNITNVTVTTALSEHLAAVRKAARSANVIDIAPHPLVPLIEQSPTVIDVKESS